MTQKKLEKWPKFCVKVSCGEGAGAEIPVIPGLFNLVSKAQNSHG